MLVVLFIMEGGGERSLALIALNLWTGCGLNGKEIDYINPTVVVWGCSLNITG